MSDEPQKQEEIAETPQAAETSEKLGFMGVPHNPDNPLTDHSVQFVFKMMENMHKGTHQITDSLMQSYKAERDGYYMALDIAYGFINDLIAEIPRTSEGGKLARDLKRVLFAGIDGQFREGKAPDIRYESDNWGLPD